MSQTAPDFLSRCFAVGDTIALLLRRDNAERPTQRIVRLEQALAPTYLRWLAHENHGGANVYIAANPLRSGSRKRTKESIASVRHLYIDIDTDGDARLAALLASDAAPTPTVIVSTSRGKYQVLWRVDGFDFARQEQTLKLLAIAFGGDPACTDCNRVLRIPGFANRKYSPAHTVTVEYGSPQPREPTDFQLQELAEVTSVSARRYGTRKRPHRVTHSEDDWAFVCAELADGKDAGKLTHELASRRTDKPNPL